MAKVIGPLHSMGVRGSLLGMTFRKWRDLTTVSAYTLSEGDSARRGFSDWGIVTGKWGCLTGEQRLAWRAYAKKEQRSPGVWGPKKNSGYICFCKMAYLCERNGISLPVDPPGTVPPNQPNVLSIGITGGGYLEAIWDPDQDGDYIQLKGTWNHNDTRRMYDYKLGEISIEELYQETYVGPVAVADRVSRIKARIFRSSGQSGPWGFADFIN